MGVVNVTPDSFSDGGLHFDPEAAVAAARRMIEEGAAIVDVGGESTRPGSGGVALDEELRRVVPVLEELQGVPVSVDTAKAEVARRALELGAELVNDVTAFRSEPALAEVCAAHGAYVCLMHMQGEPRTMQLDPRYDDVAGEVAAFLEERMAFAVAQGVREECICLDPGIGFGKTVEHNVELLRRLDVLLALGRPVLIGLSRKSSLGRLGRSAGQDRSARCERRRRRCGLRARRDDPARARRPRARGRTRDRAGARMSGRRLDGARQGAEVPALPAPERG